MSDRTEAASGRRWRRVPAVTWLPRYERGWLRGDVVAGAVVAALAVPQALGYASIAGAPVQVGLYAVPVALVGAGLAQVPGLGALVSRRDNSKDSDEVVIVVRPHLMSLPRA